MLAINCSYSMGTVGTDCQALFGEVVPVSLPINRGYLLSMALDGKTGRSFIPIMDAARLADGPIARIMLTHHTPLSFHGFWQAS